MSVSAKSLETSYANLDFKTHPNNPEDQARATAFQALASRHLQEANITTLNQWKENEDARNKSIITFIDAHAKYLWPSLTIQRHHLRIPECHNGLPRHKRSLSTAHDSKMHRRELEAWKRAQKKRKNPKDDPDVVDYVVASKLGKRLQGYFSAVLGRVERLEVDLDAGEACGVLRSRITMVGGLLQAGPDIGDEKVRRFSRMLKGRAGLGLEVGMELW